MRTVCLELEAVDVHNEEEDAAPLHVFQEPVAHPEVVAGPLYQSRQVRQRHPPEVGEVTGGQVGLDRGERIAGYLGTCSGDCFQQRALAGIGKTHKPNVRYQLQVKLDAPPLASDATVVGVPGASWASFCHQDGVLLPDEVP